MKIIRSTLLAASLCAALGAVASGVQPAAAQGVSVHDLLEKERPSAAENAARFNRGVAAYDAGDFTRAFEIWLPIAQENDLAAMRNVALLLREGKGVEKDPQRALYFFERAGRAGLVSAQVNTAFMYLNGEGTAQDYKTASFWFHAAAVAGVPAARYNLGVLYERGLGVERDPARALAWYALAAQAGHELALKRLTELVPSLPGPEPQKPEDSAAAVTAATPAEARFDTMKASAP
ncbi:tetratricopeptide repeat protein [Parvibaculum sp.]|uniref:tetratricopeptide repeat protein n=1 Tax=Parvibaculum sp. TaxID=2024848 RepID=UPI002A30208F|nr:sel1 repeat family protein [Parvibaculum sp.]